MCCVYLTTFLKNPKHSSSSSPAIAIAHINLLELHISNLYPKFINMKLDVSVPSELCFKSHSGISDAHWSLRITALNTFIFILESYKKIIKKQPIELPHVLGNHVITLVRNPYHIGIKIATDSGNALNINIFISIF